VVSVEELRDQAASMEEELSNLRKSVNEQRQNFHAFNYFTTQQLLQIRRDLGNLKQDNTTDVTPQLFSLLKSFSWQITTEEIKDKVTTVGAVFSKQESIHENEQDYTFEVLETEIVEHVNIDNLEESQPPNSEDDCHKNLNELIENLSKDEEEIFEQLRGYEYSDLVCYKAVQHAFSLNVNGNNDDLLDAAMDWCFDNANQYNKDVNISPDVNKSINTAELSQHEVKIAVPPKVIYDVKHPVVQELLKLNFTPELAIKGTKLCNGNFEQASEWCLNAETENDNLQQSLFASIGNVIPVLQSDKASLPVG